jgi:hypothetical protein
MEQYPDSIVVTVRVAATQDSNGNWVDGSSTNHTFAGRAEPNGTGRKVANDDGILMDFAFIYYMPQMTTVIPTGSTYVLTTLNNGVFAGNVKRPSNGQLNSRLWL